MRLIPAVLALMLALPPLASAQDFDLGRDLTAYRRFLIYPHLQKGWESMQRGERDRALTEFEQARRLAPENASVALHLAAAYRKFGETSRAESVLREQLKRTPDDARLRAALTDLRATAPRAASLSTESSGGPPARSGREAPTSTMQPRGGAPRPSSEAESASVAAGTPATVSRRQRAGRTDRVQQHSPSAVAQPAASPHLNAGLSVASQTARFDEAERQAGTWLTGDPARARLFDELTYTLVEAGATGRAARVLLQAYPFAAAEPAERATLFQRLGLLVEHQPGLLTDDELFPLRDPLDTPALRSQQAALWANLHDCAAVRATLADLSTEYGYDDWMRLGDCSTADAPALAQQAYARAHALKAGGRGSRALAYSAYASGDYPTALDAWRSVGSEDLSGEDLMAAATTALSAGDRERAATWLARYRERGDTPGHRYWSLLGQSYENKDDAAAIAASEQAVALGPDLDDYLRLARLDRSAGRQVHWLEAAAELDRANATVQLQLAFAYTRAGRTFSALSALERAAAIDPDSMSVQVELGHALWRTGYPALAQQALERAWRADPSNLVLAQQLVYVAQRLKQNETARWFAERVLDSPAAFTATSGEKDSFDIAERQFAFRRLHEDLGRRVTINLDGFSGTRVGTATSAPQAGNRYSSYSQVEADVRLGSPPIRDGSTLSAYARLFGDGGEQRSALPSANTTLGVGLRWKPWRSQVIYLSAENQMGLEDHTQKDVLLRASASFFNGGSHSDDWHPSPGWLSTNLYLDAAHYLKTDHSAVTADYRTSYHRAISSQQTVEPYGHLQFNGARDSRINRDFRGGAGVRWNIWYGGTTYDAYPHRISLGFEFQQAFENYSPDRNGVFATFSTRW